jgi:hypothetical protein
VEILGAERNAVFHLAQPAIPIDIFGLGLVFNQIIPFALGTVAAVIALAPNEGPELATFN